MLNDNENDNIKALNNFLMDIECLEELEPWTDKFNLFDVLKLSRAEIRHSNMLAWLFDPNENHGIGGKFLTLFFRYLSDMYPDRYKAFDYLLLDEYSFTVQREWNNIDILISSEEEKQLIVIENKTFTGEHDDQLNRYRNIIESHFPDHRKAYIYLTPDGTPPSDEENWDVFSYGEILSILEKIYSGMQLVPDTEIMIRNYIELLRRDIVKDDQLINICNKIYIKHRKALDLIFENKTAAKKLIHDSVNDVLTEISKNSDNIIKNANEGEAWNDFKTAKMNNVLPNLSDNTSSWNTKYCYRYWIDENGSGIRGVFEFGLMNVPDDTIEKMKKISEILNKSWGNNKQYKKVFTTRYYEIDENNDIEEQVEKQVKVIVEKLTKKEEEILSKLG